MSNTTCEASGCREDAVLAIEYRDKTSVYCNRHGKNTQIEFPSAEVVGHKGGGDFEGKRSMV